MVAMTAIYLTALAIIAATAVWLAVKDETREVDGKTDERWSKERIAWLRECGRREGTWEPLRGWEGP